MSNDFYTNSILPYVAIIIKICRAYSSSEEDFKDYYQEVCLQIWRSKDNFNGRDVLPRIDEGLLQESSSNTRTKSANLRRSRRLNKVSSEDANFHKEDVYINKPNGEFHHF